MAITKIIIIIIIIVIIIFILSVNIIIIIHLHFFIIACKNTILGGHKCLIYRLVNFK